MLCAICTYEIRGQLVYTYIPFYDLGRSWTGDFEQFMTYFEQFTFAVVFFVILILITFHIPARFMCTFSVSHNFNSTVVTMFYIFSVYVSGNY